MGKIGKTAPILFSKIILIDKITTYDAKSYSDYYYCYSQQYKKIVLGEFGFDSSESDVMFNQNKIVIKGVSPMD